METLTPWLTMAAHSLVLLWGPALLLALGAVGAGVALGWRWQALWLLPAGPLLALAGWVLWALLLPTAPTPAPVGSTRIAHLNTLYFFNPPAAPKVAFVQASGAEVMSLMEVNPTLRTALAQVSGTYPYQMHSGGPLPMMLLAKYPITRAQGFGPRMVLYHIAKPKKPYYVLQIHPQSPHNPQAMAQRSANLAKLIATLPALPHPLMVVGDFNTTPWDTALKPLHTALKQAGGWRAYLPTFHRMAPVTPIDALYYSTPFTGGTVQHIRVAGTDHLGLVFDITDTRPGLNR